ncbi:acetyl/propionyl/methylcrotonyl-CoA carboxylase subunit alpha [Nocardioides euryhalodurans]|uniref:ATP-grasp domain-containing protein n=1 Tax=Nocardioides euryhalodurans TaxID=2518370 RepID=A0A4P7GMF4_9ACTN|nr:biotin carboxylase N-terminal domain-containing protein [Nocardioides euryhalodurans]QBR93054.1 ATP-grasp domain-containing protein [Nocardioides euryhalodurans]
MISRLLVANRAEIASRVFRTCRSLGIQTVAVHSDADAGLPYVREADVSVRLPGNAPSETYLDVDALLHAAKRTGADAIHPGYGFLSENADFARAVGAAGLAWVGPSPESIEAMGSKIGAKRIMRDAGVPVLQAPAEPSDSDLPLIVKASAGGGGRGMRIVRDLARLDAEVALATAEAESAFGDGTVFVEPYVERSRHVEVQVVGDRHGDVLVLGERDCSIQRRHQKVVEEAPAPDLDRTVAAAMHEAARAAATAIGYVGAGTVEFLYDPETERFFFLEMNTRLQVEHPVTEEVFGVDLVALQLAVAEGASCAPGRSMDRPQAHAAGLRPFGHAIEVRLYAEDPTQDFQPQSGVLTAFEIPVSEGLRVEAGFAAGSEVSTHYDAMLAKVIAHGPSRLAAARRLAGALDRARIHGVTTNRDLLVRILRDPDFLAARVATDFLDRTSVVAASDTGEPPRQLLVAATVALAEARRDRRVVQHGVPVGWRNVTSQPQVTTFEPDLEVAWYGGRDGYVVDGLEVASVTPRSVTLVQDGIAATYAVRVDGTAVEVDGPVGHARLVERPRFTDPADAVASGSLLAPMPGTVVRVAVAVGDVVEAGQQVLVLEAMKMQHPVAAPHAGTVTEIDVRPGAQVAAGEVLAVVEEEQG